jgi:hypothetical protein
MGTMYLSGNRLCEMAEPANQSTSSAAALLRRPNCRPIVLQLYLAVYCNTSTTTMHNQIRQRCCSGYCIDRYYIASLPQLSPLYLDCQRPPSRSKFTHHTLHICMTWCTVGDGPSSNWQAARRFNQGNRWSHRPRRIIPPIPHTFAKKGHDQLPVWASVLTLRQDEAIAESYLGCWPDFGFETLTRSQRNLIPEIIP